MDLTHDSADEPEGPTNAPPASSDTGGSCLGSPRNCELLTELAAHSAKACRDSGITGTRAVRDAAAVGLVIQVWRNGPVEAMHAGRRGPDDAAMFATSTALHSQARTALAAPDHAQGLLGFEDHLLDRDRPWPGTGGRTLTDLGYGHLGTYARHVKDQTNHLLSLARHTCVADPLTARLIPTALSYGSDHLGMPAWSTVVNRIAILLSDTDHLAWGDPHRGARALRDLPPHALPIEQLTTQLLTNPSELPDQTLQWLSKHLLYCAAPPYSTSFDPA